MSKKIDAATEVLDLHGGELLALLGDLVVCAAQRSEGHSAVCRAATEEEVRLRFLEIQLKQLIDKLHAALAGDDHV